MRARQFLDETLTIRRALDDLWGVGYSTRELGYVAIAQGDYVDAKAYLQESLDAFKATGAHGNTLFPLDALGTVLRLQGDYTQAESYHRRALSISLEVHELRGEALARLNLGRLSMLKRDRVGAEAFLRKSLDIFSQMGHQIGVATVSTALGALCGRQPGRRVEAGTYLRDALEIGSEFSITPVLLETFLELAIIILADRPAKQPHAADWVELLTFVRDHPASTREMQRRAIEELEGKAATPTVAESLDLTRALSLAHDEVTRWIDDESLQSADKSSSDSATTPEWLEPLTEREMDILRLIDRGQTNRKIASELVLTVGTVKWYTNQIYSKLNVKNRSEATHVAHRFGLLP